MEPIREDCVYDWKQTEFFETQQTKIISELRKATGIHNLDRSNTRNQFERIFMMADGYSLDDTCSVTPEMAENGSHAKKGSAGGYLCKCGKKIMDMRMPECGMADHGI